jgi:hypothetical protein
MNLRELLCELFHAGHSSIVIVECVDTATILLKPVAVLPLAAGAREQTSCLSQAYSPRLPASAR